MAELFADLDVLVVPPVGKMLKLKRFYGQESIAKKSWSVTVAVFIFSKTSSTVRLR